MSRQNQKSQYLSAPCPREARNYSSTGRPFTKADLSPRHLEDTNDNFNESCEWNTTNNTTQDSSQNWVNTNCKTQKSFNENYLLVSQRIFRRR